MKTLIRTLLCSFMLLLPLMSNAAPISGKAPNFTLASNGDSNIQLSELRGKVVMVNFWATWCGPCRQEMPELDKLYQRYSSAGFEILGVNVEQDRAEPLAMLKKKPVTFPILFDTESIVSRLYDVSAMPTTVLIDRDGNLRQLYKGYKPGYEDKYRADIRALIKE